MLSVIKFFHQAAFLGNGGKRRGEERRNYFIIALLLFTFRLHHDGNEYLHRVTDSTDQHHNCVHHPGAGGCNRQRAVLCRHPRQPLHENTYELSHSKPGRSGHHCGSVCRSPVHSNPRLQAP